MCHHLNGGRCTAPWHHMEYLLNLYDLYDLSLLFQIPEMLSYKQLNKRIGKSNLRILFQPISPS